MIVWCERDGSNHQIDGLICVYSCPESVKILCKTYTENYEKLKSMLIEQKYLTSRGLPNFPIPKALRPKKEKKRRVAKEGKPKAVEAKVNSEGKPKRKRRTKAEMLESKGGK